MANIGEEASADIGGEWRVNAFHGEQDSVKMQFDQLDCLREPDFDSGIKDMCVGLL